MVIDNIDGLNRRIYLHADTVGADVHPMDVYTEMREMRKNDEALRKYNLFLSAHGNESKGGGKATERYVKELEGTRVVPYDTTHELTITGVIITDDGQEGIACFDRLPLTPSVIVDINYIPPQVEVITVDTGGSGNPWSIPVEGNTAAGTFGEAIYLIKGWMLWLIGKL